MSTDAATTEPVPATSGDVLAEQIAKLRKLFPEIFVEGKIDFDKLRATLGAAAESGPGRFSFTWAGKDDALTLLQTPSRATLTPCPEESVTFGSTGNVFIEGDNLEVLKLLFKPYFGRVKLIYIDPPYNTGQDFIYRDNYADPLQAYLQLTGQTDAAGNLLTSNPETSGRYHSAWLSMMYPRLFLARQLLRDDGVILVSIDDHEVHHLRLLMNEVFGEDNFLATFIFVNEGNIDNQSRIKQNHEYVVAYAREDEQFPPPPVIDPNIPTTSKLFNPYIENTLVKNGPGNPVATITLPIGFPADFPSGVILPKEGFWPKLSEPVSVKDFCTQNEVSVSSGWSARELFEEYIQQGFRPVLDTKGQESTFYLSSTGTIIVKKRRLSNPSHVLTVLRGMGTVQEESARLAELGLRFDYPKPTPLLKYLVQVGGSKDALVLDFFAGACTTAQAVMELNREDDGNRKFIMIQLPEPTGDPEFPTIAAIGKERIRRVIAKMHKEGQEQLQLQHGSVPEDLGCKVFKLSQPNIRPWVSDASRDVDVYADKLSMFNDPLVTGWTADNVLWEVALREGFGLNTQFSKKELANGNAVYEVTDPDKDPPQTFTLCLDDEIRADFSKHYDLAPDHLLVCRDRALDDTAAANLALQCRLKTI
jgi:adenine-specific DNA-methyltransferase